MLKRFARWLLADEMQPPAPAERQSAFTTDYQTDARGERAEKRRLILERLLPAPKLRVLTEAMDDVSSEVAVGLKATYQLGQTGVPEAQLLWYGSQGFIGYQMCAILAQQWLINKACLTPARDAVRNGYKITVNDGSAVGPKVLEAINKGNKRYGLDKALVEFVKMGRVFGIRIAICVVESNDPAYYSKPFNPDGVLPGKYRGISQVDPYWVMPELTQAGAANPAAIGFYEPAFWVINGVRYHKSHLIIIKGPEVADILKPSYLYGGMSVPQLIYERVYAAERTANEAPQLALSKRSVIMYTDVAKFVANQADSERRVEAWARFRDNFGVKIADKDGDKVEQIDTALGDLDETIMTQYQLVAAASEVPATKLMGTTPKGFNSSGDYETDSYHETLGSIQTNDMEPLVDRHLLCMIRSDIAPAAGIAPFGVTCTWNPLDPVKAEEQAAINKINAETAKILVEIGAIEGSEARDRLAADEHSGYNGLPVLENLDAPETEAEPDAGEMGNDPQGGPDLRG